MVATENSIYISDKAKTKVLKLMDEAGVSGDETHFLRLLLRYFAKRNLKRT